MNSFYTFFITFIFILFSELGDKTQFLILSFSTKTKLLNIILGITLGTFFSHGIAIFFGSFLGNIANVSLNFYFSLISCVCFLLVGLYSLYKSFNLNTFTSSNECKNKSFRYKSYILIIALSIFLGELGDKTFFTVLNLGIQYPNYKISILVGSLSGMILSNYSAIFIGKLLKDKINSLYINIFSSILFIIFGLLKLFYIFN